MMELATQEKIIEKNLAYMEGTETKLSPGERERLDAAVKIIDKGMDTFLTVGVALLGIKEGKLYRETHPTFEAFCKAKWSMSRPRAYQLIASVKVVNNLSLGMSTTVDKPTSERQVRVLAALPQEQQAEAWTEAVATAPKGKVTVAHVQTVVDKMTGKHDRVRQLEAKVDDFIRHLNGLAAAVDGINEALEDWPKDLAGPVWTREALESIDQAAGLVMSLQEDMGSGR